MTDQTWAIGPTTLRDVLQPAGDLPADWSRELLAIPREYFIPPRMWVEDGGRYVPVDRSNEPQRWRELVYSDRVIVTQFDDGETHWPDVGLRPSCSASMPSAVFGMLGALDVRPGQRALDVGTGTGYNAALLAARVGAAAVTTMEIDAALADLARVNLADAQRPVTVIPGDGADGYTNRAPYDRIIATAAVQLGRFPQAWIDQSTTGGVIVAPIRTDMSSGPLVRFEVGPGRQAIGRPVPLRVGFMELRGHRNPLPDWAGLRWDDPDADSSVTEIVPWPALLGEASLWAIGVAVPACRSEVWERTAERGHGVAWLVDPLSQSWASVVPSGRSGQYTVRQHGPRRLWDEVAAAYQWWLDRGQPGIDDWRFTIEPNRQVAHLT